MPTTDTPTPQTTAPRIGLALGSGAARGWAHIGVLRALAKAGIKPDIIAGTSMGALVGGVQLAGHLDTLAEWALSLNRKRIFSYLDLRIAGGGLLGGQPLVDLMARHLGDRRIEDLPVRFTTVVTDLVDGHEMWLRRGPLVETIRAAIALPGLFTPVSIDGRWYVDGALVNPVPVSVCRALGARYVIAVTVSADYGGRGTVISNVEALERPEAPLEPEPEPDPNEGILARNTRVMKKLVQRQLFGRTDDSPGISTVMMEALNIVQDRIARSRLAGDPPDVIIAPRMPTFGLFDFHRAEAMIECGVAATNRHIEDIKREIDARRETGAQLARSA